MHHTPRQGFHSAVDNIGAGFGHLEGRSHRQAGTRMAVILNQYVRIFLLDFVYQLAQRGGTADTGHILQRNLVGAKLHQLVDNAHIILDRMNRRVGDAERGLADHSGFFGIFYRKFQVARVVQAAERTHNVDTLRLLDLRHQSAHVGRYAVHTQAVQSTFQHMCLYASLVELLGPGTDGLVGVLAIHQIHLLESTAIGLNAVETAHSHDDRRNFGQLVDAGLIFA